jgi:hypothetical protein
LSLALLAGMTGAERARLGAFLRLGRFDLAAEVCDCHRDTVSATWHRYRRAIAAAALLGSVRAKK